MLPAYGGLRRPWFDVGVPLSVVDAVAEAARDEAGCHERIADRAYVIGLLTRAPYTMDWVDVRMYGDVLDVLRQTADSWANGEVQVRLDVEALPLTKCGGAVLRRLAKRRGVCADALWAGLLEAHVARRAWRQVCPSVPHWFGGAS